MTNTISCARSPAISRHVDIVKANTKVIFSFLNFQPIRLLRKAFYSVDYLDSCNANEKRSTDVDSPSQLIATKQR